MKIKDMSNKELEDAMVLMSKTPVEDPCFSGWNFDTETWKNKFTELIDEAMNRSKKDE